MTPKDIPPTWHLQVVPIVFGAVFYFVGGRSPWGAVAGALGGVIVFLLRYIDAQRAVLAAMEKRIAELEQHR